MSSYVDITRDEFEEWLTSLGQKWKRVPSKAGVYLIYLSNLVGISISSSVGSQDHSMGRGQAAMHLRMVSVVTGRTLNKKAIRQTHFKRTKNWRVNWRKGVDTLKSVYAKQKSFYDKISEVVPAEYKAEWLKAIEAISGWDSDTFLVDLHTKVDGGKILSDKQEQAILRNQKKQRAPEAPVVSEAYLNRLRELYRKARVAEDPWTLQFTQSMAMQLKAGKPLSPKQQKVIDDKLRAYRVAARAIEAGVVS